jgi:hypothetical protein
MRRLPPATGAHACHREKIGERAFRHPQHRRHDGDRQHGEKRLPIKRVGIGAHAGGGGIGKLGEGQRAMGGDEHVPRDDVLAAGAREPHGVPVVVDDAIGAAQKEKSGLRGCAGLRDHAAEQLPLRIVAAAAKAPRAGEPIAAVHRHRLADRRIGPGGERGALLPDLVLRRFREAGDEPLVRGEQGVNPAGRAASARNRGNDLREHVEAMLEPAVGPRLHDAEQVRLPHAFDHVVADAAIGFGLLRALARKRADAARSRQEIGHIGGGG